MKKILLVEDNIDILESIAEILALKNYEVITAINGKLGLVAAKKHLPNLIISDITMPGLDGFELLKALNMDGKTAMIPVIFLTAKTQRVDRLQGAVSGVARYLTKPFTAQELLKNINELIENRHGKDE